MIIQTEPTPNPATLKFLPGRTILPSGTMNFENNVDAERSPLAAKLFEVSGVVGVFFGYDFVSVTKEDGDWAEIKPQVLGVMMDVFASGAPLLLDDDAPASTAGQDDDPADAEIITQIRDLLDTKVRPAVAQDGGDIVYHGFKQGTVYLHMQGACAGCPSSTFTLKNGIENLLRHYVPEVTEVVSV
ncbi:MAG: NifU family protein [Pseudomonadota bacterium]